MPLIFLFQSFFLFFRIVYHFVGRFHLSFCNIQRRYYDSTLFVSYFLHNRAIFSINDDSFFLFSKILCFFPFFKKKDIEFPLFQCPMSPRSFFDLVVFSSTSFDYIPMPFFCQLPKIPFFCSFMFFWLRFCPFVIYKLISCKFFFFLFSSKNTAKV